MSLYLKHENNLHTLVFKTSCVQRKEKIREVTLPNNDKLNTCLTNCGNSCTEIGIWLYMTAESIDL